jgi:hypothetical protein
MRLLHAAAKTHAAFDDPNLVSRAGLVPVMRLAERCGLADLVDELVRIASKLGVNAQLKVPGIVAGMVAGADSIEDLDLLRHGAMSRLFGGIRAPSTLGSFLRASPGATSGSWRRWAGRCWPGWPGVRRCCPARRYWPLWTSTPPRSGCTGTPSRAPGSDTPRYKERACWSVA